MRIEKTPRGGAPVAVRTDPDETARRATPAAGLRAASRQPTPLFASRHSPPQPDRPSAPPLRHRLRSAKPFPKPRCRARWDRTAVGRRSFGAWQLMRRPVASKAFRPEGGVEARTDAASAESLSAHDVQHVSSGVMRPVASLRMGRRASGATGPGDWKF